MYGPGRVDALVRAGAIHKDISEMRDVELRRVYDRVLTFVNPPDNSWLGPIMSQHRWLMAVDETLKGQGPYDVTMARLRMFEMQGVVTCYNNAAHMEKLASAGFHTTYLPLTIDHIRERQDKTHSVIACGSLDHRTYPLRAWLAHELRGIPRYMQLVHPGYELSRKTHQFVGDQYMRLLDSFQFGIVDRADACDRLVSKYLEFAQCHVLPVGDCPTYMDEEMKNAMVNVDNIAKSGRRAYNHEVVAELKRLLNNPKELHDRQEAYARACLRAYNTNDWGKRVMDRVAT